MRSLNLTHAAIVYVFLAVPSCSPANDTTPILLSDSELRELQAAGSIQITRYSGANEVCLLGGENKYIQEKNSCKVYKKPSIVLLEDGVCLTYSLSNIENRILFDEYDFECERIDGRFRLELFNRYGHEHLILGDPRR